MDYAYTLQGWLKGVNSISLSANFDMGGDGKTGGINQPVAKDEIGFNLNYFTGEYIPINATVDPFPTHTAAAGLASDDNRPLYNGNISSMAVNIKKLIYPGVAAYHYDQLNRITARKSYYGLDQTNNNWNGLTATKSFEEKFSYDANGNILTADRYTGATWGFMDSLTYSYYPGTNKLRRVRDFGFTMYSFNPPDIADQSATDNYTYDEIGNLTSDAQESITNVKWSVYGKILEINRTASTYNPVIKIRYGYDAAGNRISKEVQKNGTDTVEYSWYVRDAQGNIMSTYTAVGDTAGVGLSGLTLNIIDQPLYGSSRLGVLSRHSAAEDSWYPFNERSKLRGLKQYELTNHLGNVLATVSDRKTPVQSGSDPTQVDHFDADVQNAFDYYAFGMVMPDRKFTGAAYRYGFNGKENDNEVKGDGNQQDYGMRIYDPRLGRFLSVDPLASNYSFYTPYQFAGNKPIWAIDLDGAEEQKVSDGDKSGWLPEVVVTAQTKRAKAGKYIDIFQPKMDSRLWKNVPVETFVNQLRDRINNPSELYQGKGTNFCWAAAVSAYEFEKDPQLMAEIMIDLYTDGEAVLGKMLLTTAKSIRNAVGSNTFDKNAGLTNHFVDQMIMITFARNFKDYINYLNWDYDQGNQNGLWAAGTLNKFVSALTAFGNKVDAHGYDLMNADVTGKNGSIITDAQSVKKDIFLYVNSSFFKNPPPDASNSDNINGPPIPTHFVRISNFTVSGDNYSFKYWDYGSWKPHSINRRAFEKATFGIITVEK